MNKILITLIIILSGVIFYFSNIGLDKTIFISPDESLNSFFIKTYSTSGNLVIDTPNLGVFPRGTVLVNSNMVPGGFLGQYIILGTIFTLIKNIELINSLMIIIFLTYLYLLSRLFTKDKYSLIGILIVPTFASFWFIFTRPLVNNLLASFFLLIFFYSLMKSSNKYENKNFLIGIFFLSMSIFIRPDYLLFSATILPFFWMFRKEMHIKTIIYSGIIFITILIPQLVFNNKLYDSWIKFGPTIQQNQIKILEYTPQIIPSINIPVIIHNFLSSYFLNSFLFGLILLIGLIFAIKTKKHSLRIMMFCIALMLCFLYWGMGIYYGFKEEAIFSSYTRYFFPAFFLAIPLISLGIYYLKKNVSKLVIGFIIFVLVLSNIILICDSTSGLKDYRETSERYGLIKENIINITENNSIIITNYWDKLLFPSRQVLVPYFYNESEITWITLEAIRSGKSIYIIDDPEIFVSGNIYKFDIKRYALDLEKQNLKLENIKNEELPLLKIVPINTLL